MRGPWGVVLLLALVALGSAQDTTLRRLNSGEVRAPGRESESANGAAAITTACVTLSYFRCM